MSFDIKNWLIRNTSMSTLLGICPMSKEIVKASIQEAKERNFVPMFVASPRQVDSNRGYTSWSQSDLVNYIESVKEEIGYTRPSLVARDHGGPYQSIRDRNNPEISLERAMKYAREVFSEDLRAGFQLIHVDATEDPKVDGPLQLEEIAQRTVELIKYIEGVVEDEGYSQIYYEVGTEEIGGGMTESSEFKRFIKVINDMLPDTTMQKVLFIVGQVGTAMRIDRTNNFNPEKAEELVQIASKYGLFLKTHYTDWLSTFHLRRFPNIGIGAANVGPEFIATIIKGLEKLEKKEMRIVPEPSERSNFLETIEERAVRDSPWKKFAPETEKNKLKEFARKNKRDIAITMGRYVLRDEEVLDARKRLEEKIRKDTFVDPEEFIIDEVRDSIRRYLTAFNL